MTARARDFYDRVAPWVVLAIGLMAAIGIWIGVIGVFANNRQDAQASARADSADDSQRQLLDCFDEFASQLAGGLPPVRKASADRDDALASALEQLRRGLEKARQGSVSPKDLDEIIRTFADYQVTNDALSTARAENPYPAPPSAFCSTR